VYGDLSPGNVLVAGHSDHIMLIDLDNLSTEVDHRRAAVFTPNYGAPEIVTGAAPNDEHSDVFSLALLVFRVLTWTHPLHGEHALADPAMQELADLGELPWAHHPTDDRNRAKPGRGLPLDAVLTPGVRKLCARTFEEGLTDPAARPSADEWRTALLCAADFTVECPGCAITSLATTDTCMWCQTPRAQLLLAGFAAHLPSEGEPVDVKHALVLNQGRSHRIDARRALLVLDRGPGRPATDPDDPVVELRWSGGAEIEALRCGSQPVYLVDRSSNRNIELRVGRAQRVPLDGNGWPWNVHFDRVDAPHRLLVFSGVR
jgi:serine/threonine protein kinase